MLNRNITCIINWILDNILPPLFRDSRILMYFIIFFAYGKYTRHVLDFKEKINFSSDDDINRYYELIADAPINKKRRTDLNSKCIRFILKNIAGETVLDAACGRGYMVDALTGSGKNAYGIDIVLSGEQKADPRYFQGSLLHLPAADNCFDTVLCTHALEHIRDYKTALRELLRVTKKRLIIVMPKQREYRYTPDLHVNFCPYLYRFREFLDIPAADCFELGGDFVAVIDLDRKDLIL